MFHPVTVSRDLIASGQEITLHDEPDPAVISARIPAQPRPAAAGELAAHALARTDRDLAPLAVLLYQHK